MPYDGGKEITQAMNRTILIEALRSPFPEGFGWNFNVIHRREGCGTLGCAIGLAIEIGLFDKKNNFGPNDVEVEVVFGEGIYRHFSSNNNDYGVNAKQVTPAMVADALEQYGRAQDSEIASQGKC